VGHAPAAVAAAERAVAIGKTHGSEPPLVAGAELALARALWAAGGDRARAVELARAAHATFVKGPAVRTREAAEAARWLRDHTAAP
jgi:alpha-beta hydrolase superfamily lysophospholipase